MKATTRALSIVGAFALAVGTLTACSTAMTQEEACAYIDTEGTAYVESMDEKLKSISSEKPEEVMKLQKEMINKLDSIGNGIGNDTVKAPYKKLVSTAKGMMDLSEKILKDPSALSGDDYSNIMQDMSDATAEFAKVCPTSGGLF